MRGARAWAWLCAGVLACRPATSPETPAAQGTIAAMTVRDGGGAQVAFAKVRRPVTVVALWASYCGACQAELPMLEQLAERFAGDRDVAFVAIGVDDAGSVGRAQARIAELAPSLASYFANEPEMIAAILPKGDDGAPVIEVPATIVIDHRDRVHAVGDGPDLEARAKLVELARSGELPPRAPERLGMLGMKLRRVDGALQFELGRLPGGKAQAIAAIVELAVGMGAIESAELRASIEAQLDGGTVVVPLPSVAAEP